MNIEKHIFIGLDRFGQSLIIDLLNKLTNIFNSLNKLENGKIPETFPIKFMTIIKQEDYSSFKNNYDEYRDKILSINPDITFNSTVQNISDKSLIDKIRDVIVSLNNLSIKNVYQYFNSEISMDITSPKVFILTNIDEFDDTLIDFLLQLKDMNNERIVNKYSLSCLLYCPRIKNNKEKIKKIENVFESIFLIGNDSTSIIFERNKDIEDLIVNFLLSLCLSSITISGKKTAEDRFYSIGTSSVYFPQNLIIIEALYKKFGYNDKKRKEEFKELFCGTFHKIEPGKLEDPFSLNEYEDNPIFNTEEVSDEFYPIAAVDVENKASQIKDNFLVWVDNHINRMKSEFKIETMVSRLSDLTKVSTFFKVAVELWKHNIEAIDFILDYEILSRAKQKAEALLIDFTKRFDDQLLTLEDEIFNPIHDENQNSINKGILAWLSSKFIIREIIDNKIEQSSNHDKSNSSIHSEILNELFNKIKDLPRPITLFSRILILFVILVLFSIQFNALLFNQSSLLISLLMGVTLLIVLSFSIYWFSFRSKVRKIYTMLQKFLFIRREQYEQKISETENDLINNFLVNIAKNVKRKLATRHGYFYSLLNHNPNFNNSDIKFDTFNLINPTKTEIFFINRFVLFEYLQRNIDAFYKKHEKEFSSLINEMVIQKHYPVFKSIVENICNDKRITSILWRTETTAQKMELKIIDHLFKNTKTSIKSYIDVLIQSGFSELRSSLLKQNNAKNLVAFFETEKNHISPELYSQLVEKAKLTFLWDENYPSEGNLNIYGNYIDLFDKGLINKINNRFFEIIDKDNILFISIDGPKPFKDILWK